MGIDSPSAELGYERIQRREEEERQRQRLRNIQAHYAGLKDGTKSLFSLEGLEAQAEVFGFAKKVAPKPLTEEQAAIVGGYVFRAMTAIQTSDITKLRLAIGPGIYARWKTFARQSKEKHWDWLTKLLELTILKLKEKTILDFAKENGGIDNLNENDQKRLKQALKAALTNKDPVFIPALWGTDDAFRRMLQSQYFKLSKDESDMLKSESFFVLSVSEALYNIKERMDQISESAKYSQEQQEKLNKEYPLGLEDHSRAMWVKFQNEQEKSLKLKKGSLSDEISILRETGISDVSLDDAGFVLEDSHQTLLDYAVKRYSELNSKKEKDKLLPLIEVLLSQGSSLSASSSDIKFDWPLLNVILKHTDPSTPYANLISKELEKYAGESSEQVDSFLWRIFHSLERKESRREDVQKVMFLICAKDPQGSETLNMRDLLLSKALYDTGSRITVPKFGDSDLKDRLFRAESKVGLIKPPKYSTEAEMLESSMTDFALQRDDEHDLEEHGVDEKRAVEFS